MGIGILDKRGGMQMEKMGEFQGHLGITDTC